MHLLLNTKEITRRRIRGTSSLIKIYTDQLENRIVVREEGVTPPAPSPLNRQQASGPIFKDDVNVFSPPTIFAS